MSLNSSQINIGDTAASSQYNNIRKDVVKYGGDHATSGGSSNAYTLTLDGQFALVDGAVAVFKANFTNTGPVTLNTTPSGGAATGAKSVVKIGGALLSAGDIPQDYLIVCRYNSTIDKYQLITSTAVKDVIATLNAGETINGGTLPVPVYQLAADSELYACDADDTSKLNYLGFGISNSTDGNPIQLQTGGVVGGFSGLTAGSKYYVSNTVGTLSTTPGTYEILAGIAISATQILIIREDKVCLIDSNGTRTDSQTAATPKTGSFVVNTPRRAKLIKFDLTLMCNMQSGSNSTTIATWRVTLDIINQRVFATDVYGTSSGNQTSISLFTSGAANLSHLLEAAVSSFSGSTFSISNSGSASITSITSTENAVTIAYSLTGGGTRPAAIAISTVQVLG